MTQARTSRAATMCLAEESRGFHDWMVVSTQISKLHPDAVSGQICKNMSCATIRQVDADGKAIPGTFEAS